MAFVLPRPATTRLTVGHRPLAWPTRQTLPRRLLLLGLAAAALSLLYLTLASRVATTGYDLQALTDEVQRWEARNQQLRQQITHLQSLERVEREAKTRLHMGPPAQVLFTPPLPALASPPAPSPTPTPGWPHRLWQSLRPAGGGG